MEQMGHNPMIEGDGDGDAQALHMDLGPVMGQMAQVPVQLHPHPHHIAMPMVHMAPEEAENDEKILSDVRPRAPCAAPQ